MFRSLPSARIPFSFRRFDFRHLLFLVFSLSFIGVLSFLIISHTHNTAAVSYAGFRPGNIMSDSVMSNYGSMSESDIANFMHSKNPCNDTNLGKVGYYLSLGIYHIENGHFVCLADEVFDGETVPHIIASVAREYRINPQVILVLLEKEQGLISDTYPYHNQMAYAFGYGCDDTVGCHSEYAGFRKQVTMAASLFREVLDGGWTNYPIGWNYIKYHPNSACGGTNVYIENYATSALYRYTPYQPNSAALAAGYGTGDACSSYGNRNFYGLFTDWFGDPTTGIDIVKSAIDQQYLKTKNYIGRQTETRNCSLSVSKACVQQHERGIILYHPSNGAHAIYGKIYDRYQSLNSYNGILGFPITDVTCDDSLNCYQIYQGSTILGDSNFQTWFSDASIAKHYITMAKTLGAPIANAECSTKDGKNYCSQAFQRGSIVYSSGNGAHATLSSDDE